MMNATPHVQGPAAHVQAQQQPAKHINDRGTNFTFCVEPASFRRLSGKQARVETPATIRRHTITNRDICSVMWILSLCAWLIDGGTARTAQCINPEGEQKEASQTEHVAASYNILAAWGEAHHMPQGRTTSCAREIIPLPQWCQEHNKARAR